MIEHRIGSRAVLSRKDLFWGYAAQVLNIGLGLIMLPVIVRYMSPEEVGLWFVFITLAGLAQLLELGFQPTLSRNVAYVYAGAQRLSKFGIEENDNGPLNLGLLADLVMASQWIYRWIAIAATVVLLVGGTLYIMSLLPKGQNEIAILAGWYSYVVGNVINFYYGYLNSLLQGRGDVTEANKVVIASRSIQVLLSVIMVVAGFGLLGLGISSLLSTIVSRIIAKRYVFSPHHPEMNMLATDAAGRRRLVKIIWHNASRFGVVMVGVFLIWRANVLIASSYLGLAEAASYGLAIHIFLLLNTIATVPFNLALPKLNSMRSQGQNDRVYQAFSSLLVTTLLIYLALAMIVMFYGDSMLNLIGSTTKLPSEFILLGMVVVFFLEINHGTCANFITTGNQIPFVKAAIVTGVFIVFGSILIAPIIGMAGLVISQGFFQIVYNNWKWPQEVGRIFHITYVKILIDGLVFFKKRWLAMS